MAAVSETIVREYFEQLGFLVRQPRKHIARTRREEEGGDFLVWNPHPEGGQADLPFELNSESLRSLERAVVVVKGWHTDTFGPGLLSHAKDIFRFVSPSAFKQATQALGGEGPLRRILVIPALPQAQTARRQSIEVLQSRGIDGVLPFRTVLATLIAMVEVNRNYQKSDLLQVLRILKNYDCFREPQLELFKNRRVRKKPSASK